MFLKIKNGTTIDVQGLKCNLPPVGFVLNEFTGQMEKRPIITRSPIPSEQYWERQFVPDWLNKRYRDEQEKRKTDSTYFDKELKEYSSREWDRRINGVWFMNNGEAVYLTGLNYMFLQWWKMDVEVTKFRIPDLEYYYFLQYCIEDPNCLGMLEVTKRRNGKTYRAGLFAYEGTSRTPNSNSGIQSKTNIDGKKFFSKAVIRPFKALPAFFRPEYDLSGGITPKKELLFQQTNVRGKLSESMLDKVELQSGIDYQSSELLAYDGQKLQWYVRDEALKTFEVNVYDGLDVVNYCLKDDEGKIIGKALYTSTVEIEEEGKKGRTKKETSLAEQAAKQLWDDSDHLNKPGKETVSGLYRFFMPAYKLRCIDKYGKPNEEKARQEILQEREKVRANPKRLAALKRKEPLTISDAFGESGVDCHFNADYLKERIDTLGWTAQLSAEEAKELNGERGNFHWKGGVFNPQEGTPTVYWKADRNGRWVRWWDFKDQKMANAVEKRGNLFYPKNRVNFISGCDPYENDVTEDTRNSQGSGHVFLRFDPNEANSEYSNSFICEYHARPKKVSLFFDDMLKQSFYYGTPLLYENNKKKIGDHFKDCFCEAFLIKLPGYENHGIPSTPENKKNLVDLFEEYIEDNHIKLRSLRLCEDLLKFDVSRTQKFDLTMSAGWTLVANFYRRKLTNKEPERKIEDYFRTYKMPA